MAEVFREADRPTRDIDGRLDIAYPAIADNLFHRYEQQLVPFLGAGASLCNRELAPKLPSVPPKPSTSINAAVETFCQDLGLDGPAKLLLQLSTIIAMRLQDESKAGSPEVDPVRRIEESAYPPSASELAYAFCHRAQYDALAGAARKAAALQNPPADRLITRTVLRSLAMETGLTSVSAPLLSAASYLEYVDDRSALWELLKRMFQTKETPTKIHELIAEAARSYLETEPSDDYLIVTTNYDRLMEIALDVAKIPYYVITVPRPQRDTQLEGRVAVRLSDTVRSTMDTREFELVQKKITGAQSQPAKNFVFTLPNPKRLVCIYKIHGCLFPAEPDEDSVVITDEDYIQYIYRDAKHGMLPAHIRNLLVDKSLLFLGYSFSDWNIRSHYELIAKERQTSGLKPKRDYAVMREFSSYDNGFFRKKDIHIIETELAKFCNGITEARKSLSIA